ncbi:polysaccharide/polyol phosphate ABC transporter ATP-binding protein [Methanobrevibacter ruminantium M1]|uniref:Polysaccharide/polyol phosphate ABC transporter ATP-binding protein n=1 Tax=Methanobrevibacter ruminantium (strain ATCC 35063 / DSM 1093 / JCM 13430 / OCM 146 / M1) TaxID=634498 RepID=D3E311_METRM|nr:ABC transporter ATP-binding protein [Methanobrevibacter ruminantium]ADC46922.1 polysaccharide/polyol phosphate ABC transporter ATP-binding protein [Methanobrevibacter ruminantium M1]
MNQKRDELNSKQNINLDSENEISSSEINLKKRDPQNKSDLIAQQRMKAKRELIERYNMSESEAESTLKSIENKVMQKKNKKITNEKEIEINSNKVRMDDKNCSLENSAGVSENKDKNDEAIKIQSQNSQIEGESEEIIPEHVLERQNPNKIDNSDYEINSVSDTLPVIEEGESKPIQNAEDEIVKKELVDSVSDVVPVVGEKEENNEPIIKKDDSSDVDDVLSSIIPEYHQKSSIEVNNVSLSFNIENDKIDNLKEYIIRTLKRTKEKKIKFHALNNITFKIYKGEKVGIIGYNGAGKSTLLNVITGIYEPDEGNVKTYGKISPLLSLGAGFDYNYSGRENIYLNGAVLGYDKKFLESKFDEIVEFSELQDFIDLPIKNYSSGMLAKLGFSIATIVEPDILIIDEVLGVGDVNFQKKSSNKIKSLMDGGTTVLLVSHSIVQIREICDKAIWIDKGELREFGEVNEVCDHYLKDAQNATKNQVKDIRFN